MKILLGLGLVMTLLAIACSREIQSDAATAESTPEIATAEPTPEVATAEPTPEVVEMPCPKLSSNYLTSDIDDDWIEWAVQKHVESLGASSGGYDVLGRAARSSSDDDNPSDMVLTVSKLPPEGVCWPGTNGINIGLKNLSSGGCAVVDYMMWSGSGMIGDCFTPSPVPVR